MKKVEGGIMEKPLEMEFNYYLEHQDELVERYNGRILVIKNQRVIGDYDSEPEAIEETSKQEEMGTFLVQKCEPGTSAYTAIYHSRVAFR